MDTALITLKVFSYDLNEYELNSSDVLCLSNELIENEGVVITTGRLWCIQSNDTKQAV